MQRLELGEITPLQAAKLIVELPASTKEVYRLPAGCAGATQINDWKA